MNDWQQTFLQKLESARRQWSDLFEQVADEQFEPVFLQFDEFATTNGFTVTAPDCEAGMRRYKFALTENGYVLVTFRMHGLDSVQVDAEVSVPMGERPDPVSLQGRLCDVDREWVVQRFQGALDRFIVAFAAAGCEGAAQGELVAV